MCVEVTEEGLRHIEGIGAEVNNKKNQIEKKKKGNSRFCGCQRKKVNLKIKPYQWSSGW